MVVVVLCRQIPGKGFLHPAGGVPPERKRGFLKGQGRIAAAGISVIR